MSRIGHILLQAQPTLDDVFRSTRESVGSDLDTSRLLIMVLGAAALVVVVAIVQARRGEGGGPRPVNNPARLLREVRRAVPAAGRRLARLKSLAKQEGVSSPLTLLICPSVLEKALKRKARHDR